MYEFVENIIEPDSPLGAQSVFQEAKHSEAKTLMS